MLKSNQLGREKLMAASELEDASSSLPDISVFQYTPFYCEENVYMLCKQLCTKGVAAVDESDLFVVFISNEKKQVPLWNQKASNRADGVVLWDYHVVCIQKIKEGNTSSLVWDLDSTLPFPSPLDTYISETIRPSFVLFSEFERCFRIVHAPIFLRSMASDRRHMKDSSGNWIHDPPVYEAIVAQDGTVHNLNQYIEISTAEIVENVGADLIDAVYTQKFGVVVNEGQVKDFFSLIS